MRPGVTLVLGGGGFKGMAHLGVLHVLEENEVPVDRIVGTSVGALVGASYCYLQDAGQAQALMFKFLASEGFRSHELVGFRRRVARVPLMRRLLAGIKRQVALERIFRRSSAFGSGALRFIVRSLVPKMDIKDLPVPLGVCTLDLLRGEELLITEGPLCTAVTASSAVPGFFPPVEWKDTLLCDAGIVNNLPTRMARGLGAQRIVAVDLSAGVVPMREQASGMEILLRAQEISARLANRRCANDADVVITPEVGGRHWLDTNHLDTVVEAGAAAARAAMPEVLALVDGSSRQAG